MSRKMFKSGFKKNNFQVRYYLILSLIALGGGVVMWINMPWGIGVGYDSVFYLSAADNFINGFGLSRFDGYQNIIPLTHYPPGYPLLLALVSSLAQIPTHIAARWISVILFSINIFLLGWLVYRFTLSETVSWLVAVTAAVSPLLINVHLMAMTEPLYITLMTLSLFTLHRHIDKNGLVALIFAGIVAALSCITRYVGVTLIVTGCILALFWGGPSFWQRVKNTFLFGVIGLTPLLIWYWRNFQVAGTMSNRSMIFHPPSLQKIKSGISTISQWVLPGVVSGQWRIIGLILLSLIFLFVGIPWFLDAWKSKSSSDKDHSIIRFIGVLGLYLLVYLSMLGFSLTYFDQSTRLNDRILSPIYIVLILMGLLILSQRLMSGPRRLIKVGFVFVLVLWIGLNAIQARQVYTEMQQEGKGFASRTWWTSETIAAVESLPNEGLIYSNEASLIYHWTKRSVNWIPEKWDSVRAEPVEDFGDKLSTMKESILQQEGFLVIFDTIENRQVYPSIAEMTSDLQLFGEYDDGAIYTSP
jgi:4-amino-4-deoxy-L-arabinose transferase-like glycosyltransferase